MTDADLDLELRRWLAADAAAVTVPSALRDRVAGIPASQPMRTEWWHRIVSIPAVTGAVAVTAAVAMLVSGTFFTLFDRPPGADGGPCNNRQLLRALENLRDTVGYRYVDTQQHQVLSSDPDSSLANPVFEWADSLVSEVAYRAPDRTREVVSPVDASRSRGYLEQVRIGSEQWQLRALDDGAVWVRIEPWPFGNWAWGYVQNALGVLGAPAIAPMRFGGTTVPDGLTGEGGCTTASAAEVVGRVVALRIAGDGRVSDVYLGPEAGAPGNRDASRNLIEIHYTVPDASEFAAPEEFIDEVNVSAEVSPPPPSTAAPLPMRDGAWPVTTLPPPTEDSTSTWVAEVLAIERSFVAAGAASSSDNEIQGTIWTSADGVEWQVRPVPDGFAGLGLADLAWDGETLLLVGYRDQPPRADGTADPSRPESWLSRDGGATWEFGGLFEAGANPSQVVATDAGWVSGGSMWSGTTQRAAVFRSVDGTTWTTVQPEDAAFGSIGTPVVERDGTLTATSCERPEATPGGTAPCLVRTWTSSDGGASWAPGPVEGGAFDVTDIAPVSAGLLGIRYDDSRGDNELVRSEDGEEWEAVVPPTDDIYLGRLVALPDGVLLIGQVRDTAVPTASVWRSRDGATWEEIPLTPPEGVVGIVVEHALVTESGLMLVGAAWLDEVSSIPAIWSEPGN